MSNEAEVLWEEPPPAAKEVRVNRRAILQQTVANPGSWARLGMWENDATARQAASDVRCGRALRDHPPGEFEARVGPYEGRIGVWVRFVPEPA